MKYIDYLLMLGADPNKKDKYGWNSVAWACLCDSPKYITSIFKSYQERKGQKLLTGIEIPVSWDTKQGYTTPFSHVICKNTLDYNFLREMVKIIEDVNHKVNIYPSNHAINRAVELRSFTEMNNLIDGFYATHINDIRNTKGSNPNPLWFNFNYTIPTSLRTFTEQREEIQDSSVLFHLVANHASPGFVEKVLDRIADLSYVDTQSGLTALSLALLTSQKVIVSLILEQNIYSNEF
jgi:ankyrin repeat protein